MKLWLQCSVAEDLLLQEVEGVQKIVSLESLKRESNRSAAMIGSVILGGRPVPVFDVRQLMWREESGRYLNTRIVVFQSSETIQTGFMFEKVLDLIHWKVDAAKNGERDEDRRVLVKGQIHRLMNILDLQDQVGQGVSI